jgi:hypothetical protein
MTPFPTVDFDAVLIKPLDQQHDRTLPMIDPDGAEFDPEVRYPVFWNFEYDKLLGWATLTRDEDQTIRAHGKLFSTSWWGVDIQPKLAVNVSVEGTIEEEGGTIRKSQIIAAALCREHSDPEQPPIVIHAQIRSDP